MQVVPDHLSIGQPVFDPAVGAASVTLRKRLGSFVFNLLLCIVALSFLSATWAEPARAQSAEGYVGWVSGPGPAGTFPTAEEACKAQWQSFKGPNSEFIGPLWDGVSTVGGCDWTRFWYHCVGGINSCGTIIPAAVEFQCASGYKAMRGFYCIKDPRPEECPCKNKQGSKVNPTVGNPIILSTGSKLVTADDFSTSDGAFALSRTYRSLPSDSVNPVEFTRGLGGNWSFDFAYELQLASFSGSPSSPDAKLTVMVPDGSTYDFMLQSDGTWVPDTTLGAYYAAADIKLEYIGTLPSNLADIQAATSQWRLTDGDDTVWTFKTFPRVTGGAYRFARPTSRTTREGYQWTFTYRADTSLEKMTDSFGRQATFTWGRYYYPSTLGSYPQAIASVALPDGTSLRYTYDPPMTSSGPSSEVQRLVKVERLNASSTVVDSTTYGYADVRHPRHITSVTDHRNVQTAAYAYDARGRATSTSKGGGADTYAVEYTETSTEWTRRVTNPLGKVEVYRFENGSSGTRLASVDGEASSNCVASTRSVTYDSNHFIATEVDEEGRTTAFTRDSKGHPLTITEAYGTPLARTTTMTWDSTLNVPTVIAKPGLTENRTYTSGQLTNVTLTDTTSITVPYATNGRTRSWTYEWTPTGLLSSEDGPLPESGDRVGYTYTASGQLATRTDAVGHVTQVLSRDSRGAPLTTQDENGVQTVITYDSVGRPLTVTTNPGSAQSQYAMEYDNAGNLTKLTLPQGGWLSYTYDDASRVTRIDNNRGEYQTFTLNGLGSPTSEIIKTSSGTIRMQRTATYDELGRLMQSIGTVGQTWAYQYDKVGNRVGITDGRSKQWATGWDALNRAVTETDPTTAQQQYAYAANDALTQFKDGRNVTTDRVVDGFGHTIYEDTPDRGPRTYWYDEAGRLVKVLDADEAPAGTPDEHIGYSYDSTSSGNFGTGRLTSISDPSGSSSFTYDAQGRLTADSKTIQSQTYNVSYAYDSNGTVTSITYPSGHIVTYTRATDGKIATVSAKPSALGSSTNLATSVAYAPFGPLAGLTYGNGLVLTRSYDQNYWLTGISLVDSGPALLDLAFTRDGNGNATGVTDNVSSGRAASYTYTDADRLATASGIWGSDAYTWDASGNRTRADRTIGGTTTSDVATITSGTNRLTEIRDGGGVLSKAFTLSSAGFPSQQSIAGVTTYDYIYSPRKRLATVKAGGTTVGSYLYDYAGHQVVRTLPGSSQVIHYIYGQDGKVLAEHDGTTGTLIREYIWLDDMPLAQVTGPVATPTFTYVHTGQLEEPLMVTDASKAKVWDVAVDPWGNALTLSSPAITQDLRLPGQMRQAENGLFQNWNRDYDPSLGRYIEPDPIGLAGGANLFAYANGNPTNLVDPEGLNAAAIRGAALCSTPVSAAFCIGAAAASALIVQAGLRHQAVVDPPRPKFLPLPPMSVQCSPDQRRHEDCVTQWIEDTRWCDNTYSGRRNIACHAWAGEELARCKKRMPRQPFRI